MLDQIVGHGGHQRPNPSEYRVCMDGPGAVGTVRDSLVQICANLRAVSGEIVVICIGSDRSIGDALGPVVGSFLLERGPLPYAVMGTLDRPVHAGNLAGELSAMSQHHPEALVIAVDACLGRSESVGTISIGSGSLKPGAGVNKALPDVGHLYITGVVNVGGFMEYFVLQNTRLGLVYRMAKVISGAVHLAVTDLLLRPKTVTLFGDKQSFRSHQA